MDFTLTVFISFLNLNFSTSEVFARGKVLEAFCGQSPAFQWVRVRCLRICSWWDDSINLFRKGTKAVKVGQKTVPYDGYAPLGFTAVLAMIRTRQTGNETVQHSGLAQDLSGQFTPWRCCKNGHETCRDWIIVLLNYFNHTVININNVT
jgi:hypothetical protein